MRINHVLIDLENLLPAQLDQLCPDTFRPHVFVGAAQSKLPVELVMALQPFGDRARYIRMSGSGHNALDFHIAFYIGELSAQDPHASFHVISKDKGFDPLIGHLKSRKISVARHETITDIPLVRSQKSSSSQERALQFHTKLLQPKVTRPRTVTTLKSAISSFFQRQLTTNELDAVVAEMKGKGWISVNAEKVIYHTA